MNRFKNIVVKTTRLMEHSPEFLKFLLHMGISRIWSTRTENENVEYHSCKGMFKNSLIQ